MTTALHTDQYELSMLDALITEGMQNQRAVFELFARKLPKGRRFGVWVGLGRFLDALKEFTFTEDQIQFLLDVGAIKNPDTAKYLSEFKFSGDITAFREGEFYFPNEPLMTVDSTLGEGILLETLALSIMNFDSAVGAAGSRMRYAAGSGRRLSDMGGRRLHEEAAVASARAAYIVGFNATSNLEAGSRYGIPTMGTAAHAFTLAHVSEADAFRSQISRQGLKTTLLVDTYDTEQGILTAIEVAKEFGGVPGGIRIDSGDDLGEEAVKARRLLDAHGCQRTKITVTSDVDEYMIRDMRVSPVNAFGVGTHIADGSGFPTAGFVYKMVAREDVHGNMVGVEKKSANKTSRGGKKGAYRVFAVGEVKKEAVRDIVVNFDDFPYSSEQPPVEGAFRLDFPVVRNGVVWQGNDTHTYTANVVNKESGYFMPRSMFDISDGEPTVPVEYWS